jgi:tetratricopeptide (TPR) repeat protein
MSGDFEQAVTLFRDGLHQVADPVTKASLHVRIGQALLCLGRLREAEGEYRATLHLANLAGDPSGAGDAWMGLANLSLARGTVEDARAAIEQARRSRRSATAMGSRRWRSCRESSPATPATSTTR